MRVCRRLTYADIRAMRSGPPAEDDPYLTDSPWEGIPYKRVFEEHDPQTRALIEQYRALSHFHHAETVIDRLEGWRWLDTMAGPDQKQAFLEPLITAIQKDPREHEDKLVFLLIVCEPVRRGVSKEFIRIREGLEATRHNSGPASWHRREEARRLHELDRQILFDVTRGALLDALYRYPTPPPPRFFSWLRATIAHGALDHLRHELPELETSPRTAVEAQALQDALSGLETLEAPELRCAPNREKWRRQIHLRSVFEIAEGYYEHSTVRHICHAAVGRLPCRQREVVEFLFFQGGEPDELAARRHIATSTVYNHKAQALRNLHGDDVFFNGLCALGKVRDRARAEAIAERYPEGRLPDGRRIVAIDQAA
jgi:DNA-directed RNA polymerase specialized sigma24 family protein